jgi:hypothetical protein
VTIQYTVYDSTGAILRTGSALTTAQAQLQASTPGTSVVTVGSDPATQVVDVTPSGTGGPIAKVAMNVGGTPTAASKTTLAVDGADSVTISPIPAGAAYYVTVPQNVGLAAIPPGVVSDGSLIVTTTVAGSYGSTLKAGNFLDYTVTLNAS